MASNFQRFKSEVDQALALIGKKSSSIAPSKTIVVGINKSTSLAELVDAKSLLARCKSVCDKYEQKKPTIRIIHHLACSGGAELTDYIGSMSNVYLLNEVHPFIKSGSELGSLNLIDAVEHSLIPQVKELKESLFVENIKKIHAHVTKSGGHLVIRDNAYFDYLSSKSINHRSIASLLETDFNVLSLVLYRDSIDTYASLTKANFYGNTALSFDEYCSRAFTFINDYSSAKLIRYEDLTGTTNSAVKSACQHLEIGFNDTFELMSQLVNAPKFDNWRQTETDRYNTKLDSVPSFDEIGNSESYFQLQRLTKPKGRKLILIATMPRSGSTWLFNCVREIYKSQGLDFYSDWIENYDPSDSSPIHVVKVHNADYRLSSQADLVLTACRDIRDVCVSLNRMNWLTLSVDATLIKLDEVVNWIYYFWDKKSNLELDYNSLVTEPESCVSLVFKSLGLAEGASQIMQVNEALKKLHPTEKYDPVTLLHPNHRSQKTTSWKESLPKDIVDAIHQHFGDWLKAKGYL